MLSIFACVYWPFVYHLCRNVYLSPLPAFKSGLLLLSCRSSLYILDMGDHFLHIQYSWVISLVKTLVYYFLNLENT